MAALPPEWLQNWAHGWQSLVGVVLLFIFRYSVNCTGEMNVPFYEAVTAWILAENKSLCLDLSQYIKTQLSHCYL